jgi:putative membrane protein
MYYNQFGPSPFDMIFQLIGIVLLIALVIRVFSGPHHMWNQRPGVPRRRAALDLLEERYVKGEIDKTEFETKKRDILG